MSASSKALLGLLMDDDLDATRQVVASAHSSLQGQAAADTATPAFVRDFLASMGISVDVEFDIGTLRILSQLCDKLRAQKNDSERVAQLQNDLENQASENSRLKRRIEEQRRQIGLLKNERDVAQEESKKMLQVAKEASQKEKRLAGAQRALEKQMEKDVAKERMARRRAEQALQPDRPGSKRTTGAKTAPREAANVLQVNRSFEKVVKALRDEIARLKETETSAPLRSLSPAQPHSSDKDFQRILGQKVQLERKIRMLERQLAAQSTEVERLREASKVSNQILDYATQVERSAPLEVTPSMPTPTLVSPTQENDELLEFLELLSPMKK